MYTLDNSFNLNINGINLVNKEIGYSSFENTQRGNGSTESRKSTPEYNKSQIWNNGL